ncbi:acyl-CoA thioester hydrolase [Rhodopseudomonas faecalis]|uniref:Acyl-CoA thioester hydrolase n=2 Tax=Rhodopseudomonas faecalis TaxID=99655 RepID=A0A318TE17_9BRAD|nr:acyl-CoA thioester hydrolase [Rhodopseudomonas faecalis]TAH67117.1 MAG: acyl-CoA thioesterase [Rhodopseudomonas palustris]
MTEPSVSDFAWDFPSPFVLPVSPAAADIDGLNHTNNAVYVRWCDSIGWAHSEALGLCLADWQRLDRAVAIRRGEYDYLLPSFAGDQLLLGTWITASDGKLTMQRSFQLIRPRDRAIIMRGRWQLVSIELSSGRPRRMPAEFIDVYHRALIAAPPQSAPDGPRQE